MPRPAPSARPPARPLDRGAALLVVIVSTAILTAIAVDLAYATRVSLLTAANTRDELRAEYQARGAVQLSRLVLRFQNQLDKLNQPGLPRVQLYSMIPISSALTDGIFGARGETAEAPASFLARIEDEGRKVNVQMDGGTELGVAQLQAFGELVGDERWDALFEREDAAGQKVTRADVAIYLRDWTDQGTTSSGISTLGRFEDAFGDENQVYSRYEPSYVAKNARFDSVDELFLIAGIDDAFMEAFGKQLTVYPPVEGRINVNTPDAEELLRSARLMADPPRQAKLSDPRLPADLLQAVMLARYTGIVSLKVSTFAAIVESFGVTVTAGCKQEPPSQACAFTDRSLVYRVVATGSAGAVERRVDAVITFDPGQLGQEPADAGRLLHWREE